MKLLLKGARLLDENAALIDNTDLLVENGVIAAMGKGLSQEGARVEDCAGMIISPGLVVLHAHSPMHILRGLAEDVNIDDWFNREIWPYESKLGPTDIYWGARLCCAEMAENGVTAFADHYFHGKEIALAAIDTGIRADIAGTVFGFGGDASGEIAYTRQLLEEYQDDERIKIRFGPHSPYLCSPAVLREVVEEAQKAGVGIHLHVAETERQETDSHKNYGKSHCQLIAGAGGFDIPCIAAHGLWIPEEDLSLLGPDTFVAVSPKTYMKLGMGEGTLWQNWKKLNLCIGTDGAASSNSASPLEQARLFALLGKWRDAAEDFCLEDIWRTLMRGHRAMTFGSGRLAVGAPADLVVWDLRSVFTAPAYNPLAAILYSATAANIRHTIVGGLFVKRDGRLMGDQEELLENAARCARGVYSRGKGKSNLSF